MHARDGRAAGSQRGYLVNVWTVDDPHTLHALAAMGVDAVITNDPARTRQILEQERL